MTPADLDAAMRFLVARYREVVICIPNKGIGLRKRDGGIIANGDTFTDALSDALLDLKEERFAQMKSAREQAKDLEQEVATLKSAIEGAHR